MADPNKTEVDQTNTTACVRRVKKPGLSQEEIIERQRRFADWLGDAILASKKQEQLEEFSLMFDDN